MRSLRGRRTHSAKVACGYRRETSRHLTLCGPIAASCFFPSGIAVKKCFKKQMFPGTENRSRKFFVAHTKFEKNQGGL